MKHLGNFIVRFFAILFGLFAAFLSSSLFIAFGIVNGMFPELLDGYQGGAVFNDQAAANTVLAVLTFISGIVTGFEIAGLSSLPVMVAIVACELMRWKSMTIYLVLGGVCALFVMFSQLPGSVMPQDGTLIISLAAGFIGGFFYWFVAGRGAGDWMGSPAIKKP